MTELQLHRPVDERARAGLETVAASAEAACGHPVLGDGVWRDLATPSEGSAVVLASRGGALVGAMHLDGASVLGDDGVVTGSLVVTPAGHGQGVASALVDMALGDVRDRSLSGLDYWVFGDAGDPDCASGPAARELYQMRVALPLTNPRAEPV